MVYHPLDFEYPGYPGNHLHFLFQQKENPVNNCKSVVGIGYQQHLIFYLECIIFKNRNLTIKYMKLRG